MKSPRNKMITQDDREMKDLGEQVQAPTPETYPGAPIPFEGQHEKKRYFFPGLRKSVEADSQEEAERIVAEDQKENI